MSSASHQGVSQPDSIRSLIQTLVSHSNARNNKVSQDCCVSIYNMGNGALAATTLWLVIAYWVAAKLKVRVPSLLPAAGGIAKPVKIRLTTPFRTAS